MTTASTPFGDPGQTPLQRSPEVPSYDWPAEIASRASEFPSAVETACYQQLAWVSQAVSTEQLPSAAHIIANQATNDLNDLLSDCLSGSGRPAMRAARALIEHAVNLRSVLANPAAADRYMDHLSQGPLLLEEIEPGISLLSGTQRKAYSHALRKAGREARPLFRAAVAKYGNAFRRSWSQSNLKDRATEHGLDHHYNLYKFASLVAHGSAGGSLGTRRVHGDAGQHVTHRTGKALELAPIALWGGLSAYMDVLRAVETRAPNLQAEEWGQSIQWLLSMWPEYLRAITQLDKAVWPDIPARGPQAVLAVTQTGRQRWYLHLPMYGLLVEADEPSDVPPWMEQRLDEIVGHIRENHKHFTAADQRWVTVAVMGAAVKPAANARAIPDSALMIYPDKEWTYRPLDFD